MTTLWARLKIWKAFENGEITEECAQYFDELLNNHRFKSEVIVTLSASKTAQNEILNYDKVLQNIKMNFKTYNHSIYEYMQQTTFENGKRNAYIHEGDYKTKNLDKTVYLKNITGVEYSNLGEEILKELRNPNLTRTKFEIIYNYLQGTHYSALDYEDADVVGFEISEAKQRLHMYDPENLDENEVKQ